MIHYRPLGPIAAISFDLDDTLYDNGPAINRAEQRLDAWLAERVQLLTDSRQYFHGWRKRVIQENPWLAHDTTASRQQPLAQGLLALGVRDAPALADAAMTHFLNWRSEIRITDEVISLLDYLSQRRPLVAISNGNANIEKMGLSPYFKASFHAGGVRRMKPATDLFAAAAQHLRLTPAAILHIGDRLDHDIAGALAAGYQTAWFNPQRHSLLTQSRGQQLPHLEIQSLASLRQLL